MNMFGLGGMGGLFTMPSMDLTGGVNMLPDNKAVNSYLTQPMAGSMNTMGMGESMMPLQPTGAAAMGTVPTNQPGGFEQGMKNAAYGSQILSGMGGLYYGGKAANTMQDQQQLSENVTKYQVSEQETEDEYLAGINF